jgi:hypothetical protein
MKFEILLSERDDTTVNRNEEVRRQFEGEILSLFSGSRVKNKTYKTQKDMGIVLQ